MVPLAALEPAAVELPDESPEESVELESAELANPDELLSNRFEVARNVLDPPALDRMVRVVPLPASRIRWDPKLDPPLKFRRPTMVGARKDTNLSASVVPVRRKGPYQDTLDGRRNPDLDRRLAGRALSGNAATKDIERCADKDDNYGDNNPLPLRRRRLGGHRGGKFRRQPWLGTAIWFFLKRILHRQRNLPS